MEKKFLSQEQFLSFKSRPLFERIEASTKGNNNMITCAVDRSNATQRGSRPRFRSTADNNMNKVNDTFINDRRPNRGILARSTAILCMNGN